MNAQQIKEEIAARQKARERSLAAEKDLENQLKRVENQAAEEQFLREQKSELLRAYAQKQVEARTAGSLEIREKLLKWANDMKAEADAIVLPEDTIASEKNTTETLTETEEQSWNLLEIVKNFKLSAIAFVLFAVQYWLAQLIEYTIPSYLLEQLAKLSYVVFLVAMIIAVTFLIMNRYFPALMDYLNRESPLQNIEADFASGTLAAAVRLAFFSFTFLGIASLLLMAMQRAALN